MGTRNRERRAAKARQRARERSGHRGTGGSNDRRPPDDTRRGDPRRGDTTGDVRSLLAAAVDVARNDAELAAAAVRRLARLDAGLVDPEAESLLLVIIGHLWANGWQPAEVVRHARRHDTRAGRLMLAAVAADASRRDLAALDDRWRAQLDRLDLPAMSRGSAGWLHELALHERLDRERLLALVVDTASELRFLGPLPELIPPPTGRAAGHRDHRSRRTDDPVLTKVRALLAQAESTTFEAEAITFTAKAQELMARHAIDNAMLWSRSERDERPITVRLPVDDPYADIKSLLLHCVARHSRCRSVFHPAYGLGSVVGFASDVAATELLYTSLLVQSQAALQAEAAGVGVGGRARSRSFRSSFLLAFVDRIDERLAEITASVAAAAGDEQEGALLPVLAARDDAVDQAVDAIFGSLSTGAVRGGSDASGWMRGRLAADRARLHRDERATPSLTEA